MFLVPLALVVGLLVALARGGGVSQVRRAEVRAAPVVVGAIVLAILVALGPDLPGPPWWLGSSLVAGGAACLMNRHLTGLTIVALGCGLNLIPLTLNGHIAVDPAAAAAAGIVSDVGNTAIEPGFARSLQDADTILPVLGAVIPVPGVHVVVSFGDLIVTAGLANLGFRLARPLVKRPPRRAPDPAEPQPGRRFVALARPVPDSIEQSPTDIAADRPQPGLSR